MPHMYSAHGDTISLRVSLDDIGVRFGGAGGRALARRAVRVVGRARARAAAPRHHGRVVLVHESRAADAPVATVVNTFSRALAARASRTLPVYVEERSGLRLVATTEIVVRFRPRATPGRRRALLDGLNLTVVRPTEFGPREFLVAPVALRSASRALDLANALVEADDLVEYAAPNFLTEFRKHAPPNDPRLTEQWHLDNRGLRGARRGEDVRAYEAWAIAGGGDPRIVIAIVDDGVDVRHPDLAANVWRNPRRGALDRHGRDFVDAAAPYDPAPKVFNPPFHETDTNDIHGTPCAGVAAAVGDNAKGVTGIAYRCRILPVKIFAGRELAPMDRIADAIRYAGLHADVLSCSWTIPRHPDVESAIDDVARTGRHGKGCAVFCATGNDDESPIGFPASHPRAYGVGASNDRGVRSSYSNYGRPIAFVAPSDDDRRSGIVTTDVSRRGRGYAPSSAYCTDFGGTSSATPLAAGIAALLLSVEPALTWKQIGDVLKRTADKIGGVAGAYRRGYSPMYGHGRLNAHAAVIAAQAVRTRRRSRDT